MVVAIAVAVVAPYAAAALAGALGGGLLAGAAAGLAVAAAGSAITQTVAIGLDLQDGYDFNFREIAASAATMGVMDGLSSVSFLQGMFDTAHTMSAIARAAVSSALSVGMEKASAAINTGVQKLVYQGDHHFNWASTLQEVFTPDSGLDKALLGFAMASGSYVGDKLSQVSEQRAVESKQEKEADASSKQMRTASAPVGDSTGLRQLLAGSDKFTSDDIDHLVRVAENNGGVLPKEYREYVYGAGDDYQPGVKFGAGSNRSNLENLDLDVFGGFSDNYIADSFESAMSDASMWRFSGPVDYFDKAASVLGAIGSAVFDQVTQPVLQTYDLFLTARGLIDSSFNPSSFYASNIGKAAAGGADWTETLSMGLQSSTLGSMGYYSYAGTRDAMVGDYTESVLNFGAAGLNLLGARGVSSVASGWGGSITSSLDTVALQTHPLQGLSPAEVISQAEQLGLTAAKDRMVLWSGLGRGGADTARDWARVNGGTTLEMTPGGDWLNGMKLYGENSPFTSAQADLIWSSVSSRFVSSADGQVRAVLGNVRPTSIYNTVELPSVLNNRSVTGLDTLQLKAMSPLNYVNYGNGRW